MKKLYFLNLILIIISFNPVLGQTLEINENVDPQELLTNVLFSRVANNCGISQNEVFNASGNSFGTNSLGSFVANGNAEFDLDSGIVITSGLVTNTGDNNTQNNQGSNSWPGSNLYETTLGLPANSTFNATDIQFNFFATEDDLELNYVFASDEYLGSEANICNSNDGVVILIKESDEPDSSFRNIALLDNGDPVLVSNLNRQNSICSNNNENQIARGKGIDSSVNFALYSRTIAAQTESIAGTEYTIRIIIADDNDTNNDSAVFIESPDWGPQIPFNLSNNQTIENDSVVMCGNDLTINASVNISPSITYEWFNDTVDNTIVISNSPTITITEPGIYRLRTNFSILDNGTSCDLERTLNVTEIELPQPNGPFFECDNSNNINGEIIPPDGFFSLQGTAITRRIFNPDPNPSAIYEYFEDSAFTIPLDEERFFNSNITLFLRYSTGTPQENGCVSDTPIPIEVILELEPEAPILDELIICNTNKSDPAIFDISVQTSAIRNAVTSSPVIITYHTSGNDALNNINPLDSELFEISDPTIVPRVTLFARIERTNGSGCAAIRPFELDARHLIDLDIPEDLNNACDDDDDGIYEFDLSGLKNAISTEFDVELFANENDLNSGSPIPDADLNSYTIEAGVNDTIITRITDTSLNPDCVDQTEISFNIINTPSVPNNLLLQECTSVGETEADFDLTNSFIINQIIGSQQNVSLFFFESETDTTTIIDTSQPFRTSNTTIFYQVQTNTSPTCFSNFGELQLELIFGAVVPPLSDRQCDDDDDLLGRRVFDLQNFVNQIEANNSGNISNISFFENNSLDLEITDLNYRNSIPFNQNIVVQVTTNNGCIETQNIALLVDIEPIARNINNISFCDTLPFGSETVDIRLNQNAPFDFGLPQGRTPTLTSIRYFDQNNVEITDPENYELLEANQNSPDGEMITLTLTTVSCEFSTPFFIKFKPLPELQTGIIEQCEDAFQSNEFTVNNLSDFDNLFYTGNDPSVEVIYFEDSAGTIQIDKESSYFKDSSTNEIYVNAIDNETFSDCFALDQPLLVPVTAQRLPQILSPAAENLILCDNDSSDTDGRITSGLSFFNDEILNGRTAADFTIRYFDTVIPIRNEITETSTLVDGTTYTAEITDNRDGLLCSNSVDFVLTITRQANTTNPAPIEACSEDNTTVIDFDDISLSILQNEVNPDNFDVTFHNSVTEAEGAAPNVNTITTTVMSNSFVAKVTNNTNTEGCFKTVPFEVIVNTQPAINTAATLEYCANETDLDEIISGTTRREMLNQRLVADRNNVVITYHTDNAAAIAGIETNLLQPTLFVKAVKTFGSGMTCETIAPITLTEVALPVINAITDPTLSSACDTDFINDGNFAFDFSFLDSTILGTGQDPTEFNVTYHFNEQDAEDNVIIPTGTLINTGTYYVKVQQNTIGCFNIEPIQITINTLPNIELEDVVFCRNDPDRLLSANNTNPNFTYLWEFRDDLNRITRPAETTSSITLNPSDIGTNVTLIITDTSIPNNCSASKTVSVTESISPVISPIILKNFDANEVTINVEEEGDFLYGFNDNNISNAQESNTFTDLLPGMFTLYVFDVNGCDPASVDVIFVDYFPVFTPNGNGPLETESWHIQGVETIPETLVYIYNRYGKLLKTLTSRSAGWDGTYNGTPLPSDDYWILIRLPDGQEIKDHITLKR